MNRLSADDSHAQSSLISYENESYKIIVICCSCDWHLNDWMQEMARWYLNLKQLGYACQVNKYYADAAQISKTRLKFKSLYHSKFEFLVSRYMSSINRNCLGRFRGIRPQMLVKGLLWRQHNITWRWRHRNHANTITCSIAAKQMVTTFHKML